MVIEGDYRVIQTSQGKQMVVYEPGDGRVFLIRRKTIWETQFDTTRLARHDHLLACRRLASRKVCLGQTSEFVTYMKNLPNPPWFVDDLDDDSIERIEAAMVAGCVTAEPYRAAVAFENKLDISVCDQKLVSLFSDLIQRSELLMTDNVIEAARHIQDSVFSENEIERYSIQHAIPEMRMLYQQGAR